VRCFAWKHLDTASDGGSLVIIAPIAVYCSGGRDVVVAAVAAVVVAEPVEMRGGSLVRGRCIVVATPR